jgi:hypothetical protein
MARKVTDFFRSDYQNEPWNNAENPSRIPTYEEYVEVRTSLGAARKALADARKVEKKAKKAERKARR